ncbi:MAG TPA: isopentenyl-diphosphate Delta-isomerase [Chitinophagaceae bacterium]|nr:isopentenyl-diphosphate Delta-isomerase [Chitinophagaceae bacterium]
MTGNVILVDKQDNMIGAMEKLEVHRKGLLHRAYSILVFNAKGQLLLQKRAVSKYHSGGLWSNACCSHPAPDESMVDATRQRLRHEMGIDLQPEFAFKFIYKCELDKGLIEYEFDHVFTGLYNDAPSINPSEVEDWKFIDVKTLRDDLEHNPEKYTTWFKLIMNHPLVAIA